MPANLSDQMLEMLWSLSTGQAQEAAAQKYPGAKAHFGPQSASDDTPKPLPELAAQVEEAPLPPRQSLDRSDMLTKQLNEQLRRPRG